MKGLFLALLLVTIPLLFTSCGIVSNQLHRAVNLLKVPVRVSLVVPVGPSAEVCGERAVS